MVQLLSQKTKNFYFSWRPFNDPLYKKFNKLTFNRLI